MRGYRYAHVEAQAVCGGYAVTVNLKYSYPEAYFADEIGIVWQVGLDWTDEVTDLVRDLASRRFTDRPEDQPFEDILGEN